MSFKEKSKREIIEFLLKDDIYDYKRWIPIIKKFNSVQIENLIKGDKDYEYPVKNREIFIKLVMKFDNFERLISSWYEKKEYHQYLKELWLNYICIEDINEFLSNDVNDQKLTSFLESKNVKYSKWPKKVKDEFKEIVPEVIGTFIHEDEIKQELNKEHSKFNECYEKMVELKNSFIHMFEKTDEEAKEKFEKNSKTLVANIFSGLLGFVFAKTFGAGKQAIEENSLKSLKSCLVKQIQEYSVCKADAKMIAEDIIKKNFCSKGGVLQWRATGANSWSDLIPSCEGETILKRGFTEKKMVLNTKTESLPIGEQIKVALKSKAFCGLVAFASFVNLGFSIYEFKEISKITKDIAGKEYENQFNQIKNSFREHVNELDLKKDDNSSNIANIKYVKKNIEEDKEQLVKLMVNIKSDINLLQEKRRESIKSLGASIVFGVLGVGGMIFASGGVQVVHGISTLLNTISGATNTSNIINCNENIKKLEDLQKQAEEEKIKMEKMIDGLNLQIKQKELNFPYFYSNYEKVIEAQRIKANNYLSNFDDF